MDRVIQGGEFDDNRADVTLVNNISKTERVTVPTTERWFIHGGHLKNGDDVSRSCTVAIVDASNNLVMYLVYKTSLGANGIITFPSTVSDPNNWAGGEAIPVEPGYKIEWYFAAGGASTGGTATRSCIVRKVRLQV